jgi:3-isopropylmalate/(R)-2-methylmalate dehydratase small subunit
MAFAALRPGWKDLVKPGDCIVAGDNFGQGSVRALAVDVMKDLRIGCIVANSIARLYFRQAIANGIPAFPCRGVANVFGEGDELEFNIHTGLVKNLSTLQSLQGRMYPPEILTILEAGGMMPLIVAKCRELVGMPQ